MHTETFKPKDTYLNLSPEKRDRVLSAALSEFARAGYTQASVNRIVKDAGIAKGSFYQYFNDKEALFLYVFGEFTKTVKKSVRTGDEPEEMDFPSHLRRVIKSGLEFIDKHPDFFKFYQNILYRDDTPKREKLLSVVRLFPHEYFYPVIESGKKETQIRPDLSSELVIFVVNSLLESFLVEKARSSNDHILGINAPEVDVLVDQIVEIMNKGIMTCQ